MLAGGQIVAQSVAPVGGVLGIAIVMLGGILLDLLSSDAPIAAPGNRPRRAAAAAIGSA